MKQEKNTYFKSKKEIEKETGKKFKELVYELHNQGMSAIEIAKHLKYKSTGAINAAILYIERKEERSKLTNDDFILPDLHGTKTPIIEERFINELGIEFKDFLKQKYIDEKMSAYELSLLLGITDIRTHELLNKYNIKKSRSQSRQDAIDKGLIDYKDVTIKSRKTKARANGYSNIQEVFRELIKYHLESKIIQLENIDLEVIIGFNEWGILKDREVDIPIIIVKDINKLYKYSIEYNGDMWHDDKKKLDTDKKKTLNSRGWKHFIFTEKSNQSKNMNPLEEKAQQIADQIIKDVLNN